MLHNASRLSILNVAAKLDLQILRRSGTEWLARCPFCGDSQNPRHGHLYLNIRENKYYCVRCGEGGYAIGLYARMKGIDTKRAYRELLGLEDETPSTLKVVETKMCEIADIEIRHRTYSAFLDMLELEFRHLSDLKRRGLTVKQIKEKGYKSVPQGEKRYSICKKLIEAGYELKGVPGFFIKDGRWTCYGVPGYLIPVRDSRNRIQGLQVRLDEPGDGGKYRWFSSNGREKGTAAESWVHIAKGKSGEVWLTEGPLKADIAGFLSGHTFVGIPGINNIKYLLSVLQEIKARRVVIAVDMDVISNPNLKTALERITLELRKAGIKTAKACWNPVMGKGIDDALLAGATVERSSTGPLWHRILAHKIFNYMQEIKR